MGNPKMNIINNYRNKKKTFKRNTFILRTQKVLKGEIKCFLLINYCKHLNSRKMVDIISKNSKKGYKLYFFMENMKFSDPI